MVCGSISFSEEEMKWYHQKDNACGIRALEKRDAIQIADSLVLLSVEGIWWTLS